MLFEYLFDKGIKVSPDSARNQILPGYFITEKLYESHSIIIYRASSTDGNSVILKVLKPEAATTKDKHTRFKHEFAITSRLNLPGVIKALKLEEYQESLIMVLEDIGGESLDRLLCKVYLSIEQFLELAIELADTLEHIHRHNITHQDINPSNIIWNLKTKQLNLIDFGSADEIPEHTVTPQAPSTIEGMLEYISPEQTGRMNRVMDYRSDFYSLGMTFYFLLVGKLPFDTNDPLAIVHFHIAGTPVPPRELKSDIPEMISLIVMKLIAKMADDRYQSASGLKADLERCLDELKITGIIRKFKPGLEDVSDQLRFPQKLYGRAKEIDRLLKAYEHVNEGAHVLFLVAGYVGTGKTALVHEMYKSISEKSGYFIEGKCDQLQRNVPYFAWIQAFTNLVNNMLMEPELQLKKWKQQILGAVKHNGKVLTNIFPDLELIIGTQPPVSELKGLEARNRFTYLFQEFIKVIVREHPLTIFLDDMQWIDTSSLALLQTLASGNIPKIMIIGAYRSNEVGPLHPLSMSVERLRKENSEVESISIGDLPEEVINEIIADTLHIEQKNTTQLSHLIFSKTGGNPFFMLQTLRSLAEKHAIHFNHENRCWCWETAVISRMEITDNVLTLMLGKIQKLPPEAQFALKLASCIGFQFNIADLRIIAEQSEEEAFKMLLPAVQEGLVLSTDGNYQFAHDRIQQTAYSMIPEEERVGLHLQIGKLLRQSIPDPGQQKLYNIVDHYNRGAALLSSNKEKIELARLNLQAGHNAKSSGAFSAAAGYFEAGIGMLNEENWISDYSFTLELFNLATETSGLIGDFKQSERLFSIVVNHAEKPIDMVTVYSSQITAFFTQNKFHESIMYGLEFLNRFGIHINPHPSAEEVQVEYTKVKSMYNQYSIDSIINLPPITDPNLRAPLSILLQVGRAAFITEPQLWKLTVLKEVKHILKYGIVPEAAFTFSGYSHILLTKPDTISEAVKFDEIALKIAEISGRAGFISRQIISILSFHYRHNLRESLPVFEPMYQICKDEGIFIYAHHFAYNSCVFSYFAGIELNAMERIMAAYANDLKQLVTGGVGFTLVQFWQAVLNLLGRSEDPCVLKGSAFDAEKMLPVLNKTEYSSGKANLHLNTLILCYLFGEYKSALDASISADEYKNEMSLLVHYFIWKFYDSLIRLAVYGSLSHSQKTDFLQRVDANQAYLEKLSHYAPMNYLHKWHLVQAEKARVLGNFKEAIDHYNNAINLARENGFVQEEAMANELTARFWRDAKQEGYARFHLERAYEGYTRWQAWAKVEALEKSYPYLAGRSRLTKLGTQPGALDLETVMKTAHAISSEIEMDGLLSKIMHIVIENAGAQKGSLVLNRNGTWVIAARSEFGQEEVEIPEMVDVERGNLIPLTVFRFVARTNKKVVLDDAISRGEFTNDLFIKHEKTKSLICMPLLSRGKLIGILYMVNNLTTHVFTPDRVQFLEMLLSQAAISLENAAIYEALRKSESKYRLIVETASEGVWALGPDNRTTFVNSRMAQIIGRSQEEMIGQPVTAFMPKEDWSDLDKRMVNLRHGVSENFEGRLLHKNGRTVWTMVSAASVFDDEHRFNGSFAMVADITQRKQAQEEVRAKTEELDRYFNEALDLLVISDSDGYFRRLSKEWERTLGYPVSELEGHRFIDFVHPDDREASLRALAQIAGQKELLNFVNRYRSKSGSYRWIEWRAFPSGNITYSVARDITERKRAEDALRESENRLKELNENLEKIVVKRTQQVRELSRALTVAEQRERKRMSSLLHEDLQQMLLSANMRLELLSADVKDNPSVMREVEEVKHLTLMAINATKTLAVEFNPPILKSEGMDVALRWLMQHFQSQFGLEVTAVSLDPCWEIDPDIRLLLVQLVRELFTNIVKHAKTNKAQLSVTCDKETITMVVRDRGAGFDVAKVRKVARAREAIGLFSIEERLELIGGRLEIESAPGKGTVARIIVPIGISFFQSGARS